MPSKRRRRRRRTNRQRKESQSQFIYLQTSHERNLERIDSDIRTIPDQTFGKVYSTQIVSNSPTIEQISSSKMIITSMKKTRKNKSMRKKENMRKFS